MTQVGCVAQTASGLSYVGNSRRRLGLLTRWIRVRFPQAVALTAGTQGSQPKVSDATALGNFDSTRRQLHALPFASVPKCDDTLTQQTGPKCRGRAASAPIGASMKRVLSVLVLAATTLISACASGIVVTRLGANEPTATGNPWNLGMTQFRITITRHIVECGKEIKGGVEILASPAMVLDEQQRYALVSNGWWATSDITSNLAPTGISTGLNASSTDATATALSSAIGAVAQVAIGLAAGAAPDPTAVNVKPPSLCQPEVAKAVSELYPERSDPPKIGLKQIVDRDVAALATATAKVTLLTSQSGVDSNLKKQLAASMGEQAKLQERLNASQTLLASYLNLTTETQVVSWPKSAGEFRRDNAYNVDDVTLDKWITSFADRPSARGKFAIYLALYRQSSVDGSWSEPPPPAVSE